VSDIETQVGEDAVVFDLAEGVHPPDAVYGTAFSFIDRCYVRLDRREGGRLAVKLRFKNAGAVDVKAIVEEFQNELLAESFQQRVVEQNRAFIAGIAARAFGVAAPAAPDESMDDLLATGEGAFEDPLGIAMSWEEKYAKKKDEAPPAPSGEPAT
jgi:His-Xaa-Ser system protein HxsD